MKRNEAAIAAVAAFCMLVAGVVWRFGDYGLIACGAAVVLALFFVNVKDES